MVKYSCNYCGQNKLLQACCEPVKMALDYDIWCMFEFLPGLKIHTLMVLCHMWWKILYNRCGKNSISQTCCVPGTIAIDWDTQCKFGVLFYRTVLCHMWWNTLATVAVRTKYQRHVVNLLQLLKTRTHSASSKSYSIVQHCTTCGEVLLQLLRLEQNIIGMLWTCYNCYRLRHTVQVWSLIL